MKTFTSFLSEQKANMNLVHGSHIDDDGIMHVYGTINGKAFHHIHNPSDHGPEEGEFSSYSDRVLTPSEKEHIHGEIKKDLED